MLVMCQIVTGQLATLAVLELFLANLVAADLEVPHLQRHILKVPGLVNPHAAFRHSLPQLCVAHFVYNIVTFESIKMLVMSSRSRRFNPSSNSRSLGAVLSFPSTRYLAILAKDSGRTMRANFILIAADLFDFLLTGTRV